jgi:2-polyprenyl-3-methyl-5-hydroxy-6-metoxy-1,4-benzoquinol methylase
VNTKGLGGSDSTWERLAQNDPLWAILSEPTKRGRGWNVDDFFATGEAEVVALVEYLDRITPSLARHRALDFGCGVGRITRPLARHFEQVTGMDVSQTMLDAAKAYSDGSVVNCEYILNSGTRLNGVDDETYDLVYSSITLQHVPEMATLGYLAEFIRVLKPAGLAVIQLPARRRPSLRTRLSWLMPQSVRAKRHSGIEMNGIPRGEVLSALALAGGTVVDVQRDHSAGPEWESYRYAVRKG